MAPRDVQLMVVGMLAMDRKLPVDEHWFDCDLRKVVADLKAHAASKRTVQWLEYRGVAVKESFVDDCMSTLQRMSSPSLLQMAADAMEAKRKDSRCHQHSGR